MRRNRIELLVSGSIAAVLIGLGLSRQPQVRSLLTKAAPKAAPQSPVQLSKTSWKRALVETKNALKNKNLPMLAAGIAYFLTFSFFPMLAAAVAIAAIVIEPSQLQHIFMTLDHFLPKDLASMINTQLGNLTGKKAGNILIAALAIIISLYSASSAVQNMIKAANRSYDITERRGFVKLKLLSLAMTLGGLVIGSILSGLLIVTTNFLTSIGLPHIVAGLIIWLRWPVVLVIISLSLAAFYRYGPDRRNPKWQWVSWGATAATIIWLIGTALFFLYAQNFGSFSKSYGVFAGIIILMTWFNLSAFIFLLGAEVNHRLEAQTNAPTTDSSH